MFLIINIILAFNSSCQQIKTTNNDTSNIKKDIPKNKRTTKFHSIKEQIEHKIGINSMEDGFDEMEIRIWFANSSLREQLIDLQKINTTWHANIYTLVYNYDSNNALVSINKSIKQIKPKSGWNYFIDSLTKLKLLILPDMSAIKGYQLGFDGRSVTVEVATPNLYRIYSYWEPGEKSEFWQARNIEFISKFLEKEFGFIRF
jgi:hypothetical protein